MQKIATRIFIISSISFGVIGILFIFTGPDNDASVLHQIVMRLLWVNVFILLPSFALSVASKYLK